MRDDISKVHKVAVALQEVMKFSVQHQDHKAGQYSSFRTFAMKYNEIVVQLPPDIDSSILSGYDPNKIPPVDSLTWPAQKAWFDSILLNVGILISILESHLDYKNSASEEVKLFLSSKLRKAIFETPENEKAVQDSVEKLLIGGGYAKGVDYDRETGRVKFSIKEFIPDFVFPKIGLALEVKLAKDSKFKSIVDEINADIVAYSKKYENLIFLVYDLATIRDEDEFKRDLQMSDNIYVLVIKH